MNFVVDMERDISDSEHLQRWKRSSHPPHLKGKEIGLWYARFSARRKKCNEAQIERTESQGANQGRIRTDQWCNSNPRTLARCSASTSTIYATGTDRTHLKGKALGLYFARNGARKKQEELQQRCVVSLDQAKEKRIVNLLEKMQDDEAVPSTSVGRDSFALQYENHLMQSKQSESADSSFVTSGLKRDRELDEDLYRNLIDMEYNPRLQALLKFRKKLPVFNMQKEIVDNVDKNRVVVLSGETGCGKTTQVTQFILDSYIRSKKGSLCKIVCTQPRRISAIAVAERVAEERGEMCNGRGSVGWQIRLESKLPRERGSILYCTTGILIQTLRGDRFLSGVSHVFLDEIHERDLDTDFLLIILKDILVRRPDLKLILMSATLNAHSFAVYFDNCCVINIPGFTYQVKEYYLEDVLEETGYVLSEPKSKRRREYRHDCELQAFLESLDGLYSQRTLNFLWNWDEEAFYPELIVELLEYICRYEEDGAVLVFLPSWDQINSVHRHLTSQHPFNCEDRFVIIPLHSMMPTVNQRNVFQRPPAGVRKIIIATNIAETSITIDDVVYVIDCGKIKMSNFDAENNVVTLKPEWVSLANAHQRRGRAGRVKPGICYHLYSKYRESKLEKHQLPEMLRTRLENLILKIKILKLGKAEIFLRKALNPPDPNVVEISLNLLKTLNALDCNEYLTPLGFHLARLPLDPLMGRMILFGAMFSCLDPILSIAASLSFKDPFVIPVGKEKLVDEKKRILASGSRSDHLMLAFTTREWEQARCSDYCWQYFLSSNILKMLVKLKTQFAGYLADLKFLHCSDPKHPDFNRNSENTRLLRAVVCAGLYPNVARITNKNPGKRGAVLSTKDDNGRILIHPKSVNSTERSFQSEWLVYYQKVKSTNIKLYDTTEVSPFALLFFGGKITTEMDMGRETAVIDDWIRFHCTAKTTRVVMRLREKLDKVLEQKISDPGVLDMDPSTKEGAILHSIVELITSQDCEAVRSNF